MRYYRDKGEGYEEWGEATYFEEVADDNYVERAIQVYESGQLLLYDRQHPHDEYGMLPDQPFDPEYFAPYLITPDEFEQHWRPDLATNWNGTRSATPSGGEK